VARKVATCGQIYRVDRESSLANSGMPSEVCDSGRVSELQATNVTIEQLTKQTSAYPCIGPAWVARESVSRSCWVVLKLPARDILWPR